MIKKMGLIAIAAMALAAVALLLPAAGGTAWAKKGDTGATIQQQVQPDNKPAIRPVGPARALPRPAGIAYLTMITPAAGTRTSRRISHSLPPGCEWQYNGSDAAARTDFRVWVIKNSNRSRPWEIPNSNITQTLNSRRFRAHWSQSQEAWGRTELGNDYFWRVKHIPTGYTTNSRVFSVVE